MANDLIIDHMTQLPTTGHDLVVPRMIGDAGEAASKRFLEFFAVTIRNKNTGLAPRSK